MAILNKDKHKEYARFAAYCLEMVPVTEERGMRLIHREMAAEWLHLADAALHQSKKSGRDRQLT
jgi:hypothetical protein